MNTHFYPSVGFNSVIKRLVTFRERLPVEEFIQKVLIEMTRELSEEYASNVRVIKTVQEIELDMWREGSLWQKGGVYINDAENEEDEVYYVGTTKSKEKIDFNIETIRELNGQEFKSFDDYVEKRHNMFHTVTLNRNSWMDSRCDCYTFWKKYTCKHIVGRYQTKQSR